MTLRTLLLLVAILPAACAPAPPRQQPQPAPKPPPPPGAAAPEQPRPRSGLRELFPGVRADLERKRVEFDGTIPIDVHDPKTPIVYLEVFVCTPDTKEHETLVVTTAKPSHIHAALLAIGLEPGKPGAWKWENEKLESIPPTGAPLDVTFIHDGKEHRATDWVSNADHPEKPFAAPTEHFLFAGSVMRERGGQTLYEADGAGTLIGLTTFGSETIAWRRVISHDSNVEEPEWIANPKLVPRLGEKVTVRIQPRKARSGP